MLTKEEKEIITKIVQSAGKREGFKYTKYRLEINCANTKNDLKLLKFKLNETHKNTELE